MEACQSKTYNDLKCIKPSSNGYFTSEILTLDWRQLNDGISDCYQSVDENCGWKQNLTSWVNPLTTKKFTEYFTFLELFKTKPTAIRWYTMASPDQVEKFDHKIEVSLKKSKTYYFFIVYECRQTGKSGMVLRELYDPRYEKFLLQPPFSKSPLYDYQFKLNSRSE